jgi:predicted GNAT family N-acyltransferase
VAEPFLSKVLTRDHDLASFASGKPEVDDWLRSHAHQAQEAGTARVHVWTRPGQRTVVAYFALCPTEVRRETVTGGQAGGASRIPAYLIAKLAIDSSLHGQGHGSELLIDALDTCVHAAALGGGRLIVVDALDEEAEQFYLHHEFQSTKVERRLVMKVTTVAKALSIQ